MSTKLMTYQEIDEAMAVFSRTCLQDAEHKYNYEMTRNRCKEHESMSLFGPADVAVLRSMIWDVVQEYCKKLEDEAELEIASCEDCEKAEYDQGDEEETESPA